MNKKINYETEIIEDLANLIMLEKVEKNGFIRDRIKFIRLLKKGLVKTQSEAGRVLNISERQSQRIWRDYKEKGLEHLLVNHRKGKSSKLSAENINKLEERLKQSDIKDLSQACELIEDMFNKKYSPSGLSRLFSRNKIKLKTGRPSRFRKGINF